MSKVFVVFFSILLLTFAFSTSDDMREWNSFKKEYFKHYDSHADEMHHFHVFTGHKHTIDEHNLRYENGAVPFKLALNQNSDLDAKERLQGHKEHMDDIFTGPSDYILPKSIDWRDKDAVTKVKKQHACAASYAMAATAATESHYFLKTGHLLSLSDQNIIDCSQSYGNLGCSAGSIRNSFKYISDHGIYSEEAYPYDDNENYYCKMGIKNANNLNATLIKIRGYSRIPQGNEKVLQKALAIHGPISVSIDANHHSFVLYSHGIWHEPNCNSNNVNLAVLLVGYGTDEHGVEYYILKNSFGTDWGENGYFRMLRNNTNLCGIATAAMFPIV